MTIGVKLDIGPSLSHKTIILELYFKGYTLTDIELITNHSEIRHKYKLIKRYLADFIQVATLYKQKFSVDQIRLIAYKSDRLVRKYCQLYDFYSKQERLQQLLSPQASNTDAKKKSKSTGGEKYA